MEREELLKRVASCWPGASSWKAKFLGGARPLVQIMRCTGSQWEPSYFIQLEEDVQDAKAMVMMLDEMERMNIFVKVGRHHNGSCYVEDKNETTGEGPTRAHAVAEAFVACMEKK